MAVEYQDLTIQLAGFPDFPVSTGHFLENLKMGIRRYQDPTYLPATDQKYVLYMHGSGGTGKYPIDDPLVEEVTKKGYVFISISGLGTSHSSAAPWTLGYGNVQSPMLHGRIIKAFWEMQASLEIIARDVIGTLGENKDFESGYFLTAASSLTTSSNARTTTWEDIQPQTSKLRIATRQGNPNRFSIQWQDSSGNITFDDSIPDNALSDAGGYQVIVEVPPGAVKLRVYYSWGATSSPEIAIAPYHPIALLGHSLGAMKVFSWGSLVNTMYPRSHGLADFLIGNGATIAGTGNYRWNAIHRNIAAYTSIFRRVEHKAIAYYSDNDEFAPRDFSERMRMSVRPEQDNLYFISPGALGHDWFGQRPALVAGHLEELFENQVVTIDSTDPASPPAVPGP